MDQPNPSRKPNPDPKDIPYNEAGDIKTVQAKVSDLGLSSSQPAAPPAVSQPTMQSPAAGSGTGYPPPVTGNTVPNQPNSYDPSLNQTVPSISNYWNATTPSQQPPSGYPPQSGYTQPTQQASNDPYGATQGGNYGAYTPGGGYTPPRTPSTGGGGGFFGNIKPPYIVAGVGGLSFLVLLCLLVIAFALTSGGDDEDPSGLLSSPTPPNLAQQTTTTTITPIPGVSSPTPLATFPNRPTSTPFQFITSAPPPTQVANNGGNNNTGSPNAIGITSPVNGNTLRGNVTILGSASHPNFLQYALEYGPDPNGSNLWYPITSIPINRTVLNGALGAWNTTSIPDGNYQMRLHVWLSNGTEDYRVVTGLQVRNQNNPTPQTNRPPQIAPIAPVTLTKGKALTIALGISDPDNDLVTYVAQTSNASLVTIAPSGNAAITVNGLNVGQATVTVSINDGRGGTASTNFSVTVNAPPATNNPPSIAPIPALSLTTGQSISINVNVTDPDNDAVNLSTGTSIGGIATTSISGRTLTVKGEAQGSVSVNVTATDARGLTATISFTVTVANPVATNKPPQIAAIGSQNVDATKTLDVPVTISDPDNDPQTVSVVSSNNGIATASMVGTNVVRVNGVAGGDASITISTSDNKGGTATTTFNVTVKPPPAPNTAPNLSIVSDQTLPKGNTITVNLTATDAENDPISFAVETNPTGIATVSVAGTTITIVGDAEGTTVVKVTASDGKASSDRSFNVKVEPVVAANNAPVLSPIGPQTCVVGDTLNVAITYNDPDGDPVVTDTLNSNDTSKANAAFAGANSIDVTCVAAGNATVAVTVKDDNGLASAPVIFSVTVNAPANDAPVLDPIGAQACTVGDTLPVAITYSDPDGDPVVTDSVNSSDPSKATVFFADANTIEVACVAAGGSTVTATVKDDKGLASAAVNFTVTVNAPVNNAPVIDPIADQNCTVGDTFPVSFTYSDPDGDSITPNTPVSNNAGAVGVGLLDNNTIGVECLAAGSSQIDVTITDSNSETGSTSFVVNAVDAPNNAPTADPVGGQTCVVGDTLTVPISYNDPDGDPVTPNSPTSDTPAASASLLDNNTVSVSCLSAGDTVIRVVVQDDQGATAEISFGVGVSAPVPTNNPPVVDFINTVNCSAGDTPSVPFTYSDPDGNPVTPLDPPSSDNGGVAGAYLIDANTIGINCTADGSANVTITVQDDGGLQASTTFGVIVTTSAPPPTFDVTPYNEVPDIGQLANTTNLNNVYNTGQGTGKQTVVFSYAGDQSVASSDFLDGFSDPAVYSLGASGTDGIVGFYGTNFTLGNVSAGDNWTIEDLFNASLAPADCNGATPLQCEIDKRQPTVMFISFRPSNATATAKDVFQSNLISVVDTLTSNGVIPVLATLPDDGSVDPTTLAEYNEVIVTVAQNAGVPLWNVYNAMQGVGSGSVYNVSGNNAFDLNDTSGGVNRRNLSALQVLQAIKNQYFP